MDHARTIAIAGTLLADGRAEDVADMVEPLLDPLTAPAASTGQILLRGLLARVEILHRDDVSRGFEVLPDLDEISGLCTCVRAEVALWRGWGHARRHGSAAETANAIRLLKDAEELFASINDSLGRCWALLGRAQAYFALDEYGLMREMLNEATPLVDRLGDAQAERWLHELRIPALRFAGQYDDASEDLQALRSIADDRNDSRLDGSVDAHAAALAYDRGEVPQRIIELAERATAALHRRSGSATYPLLAAVHAHVGALRRMGARSEALDVIANAESGLESDPVAAAHLQTLRARIARRRGERDEARGLLDDLLDDSPHIPHGLQRSHIALLYGELLAEQDELDEAETWVLRAHRNARETGHRGNQLRTVLALATLAAHRRQFDAARERLAAADRYDDCLTVLPHAYRWFYATGFVAQVTEQPTEARRNYELARRMAAAMGDRPTVRSIERVLGMRADHEEHDARLPLSPPPLARGDNERESTHEDSSVATLTVPSAASSPMAEIGLDALAPLLARTGSNGSVGTGEKTAATAGIDRDPTAVVPGFVAQSDEMRAVADEIRRICPSHSPVLLTGESGVGKAFVGRVIHQTSERADGPLERLSCAPTQHGEPIEAKLFGIGRSASRTPSGLVHDAEGGTLVLEEIDGLSAPAQRALLQLLDTGTAPTEGTETIPVDVRIVATTTANLDARVEEGRFDQSLRDRLRVVSLRVPPLRERRADIPLLVRRFIDECRPGGIGDPSLVSVTQPAREALLRYNWPGNVRQLRNEIERALHYVQSEPAPTIGLETLHDEIVERAQRSRTAETPTDDPDAILHPDQTLSDVLSRTEKAVIERVLQACDGQITASADVLGLTRQGLYKKMKRLDIDASTFQSASEPAPTP